MFYINGQFIEEKDAKISILDLGLIRGYGVFDFLRTYGKRPFHLNDHLLRLKYSAMHIGMHLPSTHENVETIIEELLQRNSLSEACIKIILTGGVSSDQITPQDPSNLMIYVQPLSPLPTSDYERGITATTTTLLRSLPTAKTLQYIPAIIALQKGRTKNAKEALYINSKNEILEATTSNFFAFTKEGTLVTCDSDEILLGITREVVLRLAQNHFPIETRSLKVGEIAEIQECFITSSNKEILPVTQIDDQKIGSGGVGPLTRKLMDLFKEYTLNKTWSPLNILRYTPSIPLPPQSHPS